MLRNQSNRVKFLLGAHLGSTSVTVNSNGTLYAELRYKPWGATRYTAGSTPTSYQYTGQRKDATGLYFYNARYYDPALGRFLAADAIVPSPGNPQSLNRYSYCLNNPLAYTDPTGHAPSSWNEFGGGGLGYWQFNAYVSSEYKLGWAEFYARWSESLRYSMPASGGSTTYNYNPNEIWGEGQEGLFGNGVETGDGEIGIIVRQRGALGLDDPGHWATYTRIDGNIQVRGYYPQEKSIPSNLNKLFEGSVPAEVRDDAAMLTQIGEPGVVHASRYATRAEILQLRVQLGDPGPRDTFYSFNPNDFPDTYNCVTWGCSQVFNDTIAIRQGRIKLAGPTISNVIAPWVVE